VPPFAMSSIHLSPLLSHHPTFPLQTVRGCTLLIAVDLETVGRSAPYSSGEEINGALGQQQASVPVMRNTESVGPPDLSGTHLHDRDGQDHV